VTLEVSTLPAKMRLARAVGALARVSGRGGGTSLPGKVLLRLDPLAITELSSGLREGSAVISATNGKTTTAAMCASILSDAGHTLVHNRAGANMAGGIASTLLAAAFSADSEAADLGLFEVDELWLQTVTDQLRPRAVLLSNLFRDQLDRYGELETIAERWSQVAGALPRTSSLVLNADDPLIADLGRGRDGVSYFGVEDDGLALTEMQHASDSKHCRRCGSPYHYDAVYLGHLGHYHCANCGQTRPAPAVRAEQIRLRGTDSATFMLVTPQGARSVTVNLPGLYNVYNALAAAALCLTLGAGLEDIVSGLRSTVAPFGRSETVTVGSVEMQMLLIKNPAGTNEVLRTLVLEREPVDLLLILNDNIADGRDVSWVWDADFEMIASQTCAIVCSGTRAAEMAVRLKYAGAPEDVIRVVPAVAEAIDAAVADRDGGRLYALPTYTALLELREELGRRGYVDPYWERR
jgi:UDP-N-acetylmuramyl tripeptide synthase